MPEVAQPFPEIYQYILNEEANYRTTRVPLARNWRDWNMFDHIDRSFTLKNSRFFQGSQDYTRPFNNIILPIANVHYRTEGFDVKNTTIYVDNPENYHKSFLAKKYHNWWAKKHKIDTSIDESVVSYYDYGLTLLKNVNQVRPEVVPLQKIAFCDQTDVLAGPICLKHNYSVAELLDMKGKWDADKVDNAVLMSRKDKDSESEDGDKTETPGKYIEIYELHGYFPESWLGEEVLGEEWQDTGAYSPQIHIVTYYVSPTDGKTKVGVTLFKGKEPKSVFKALKRDDVFGRACGRGGIEELFHPQIWTNYSEIHIQQMLEAVSKVVLTTNKKKIAQNNDIKKVRHNQIIDLGEDGRLQQLALQPINKVAFDNAINKWEQVARTIGSAADPQLGLNPVSGTPLGTTEIVTSQGQGIHAYRQGQIADFWAEVYRDWVIPHLAREIRKPEKWLEELSLDELKEVANNISTRETNRRIKESLLKPITLEELETTYFGKEQQEEEKEFIRQQILKGDSKKFLEIIEDEFKNLPMDIEIDIAGKQNNLGEMVTKLNSVFRTLFTPGAIEAIQQNEELAKLLNEILETAGLSPVKFAGLTSAKKVSQGTPEVEQPTPAPEGLTLQT